MLTLFAIPKPFTGAFEIIQRNAIQSWIALRPTCEIILIGDDYGTQEVAKEFGIKCMPRVAKSEKGIPLISGIFEVAERAATFSLMCYVNADIILMNDFLVAVKRVLEKGPHSLMIGRRWDIDLQQPLDFSKNWEEKLRSSVFQNGKIHSPTGKDYFVFPKGIFGQIPPFIVGRPSYDDWFIFKARSINVPVTDLSEVVMAVHQNHDYSFQGGRMGVHKSKDAKKNLELLGGYTNIRTVSDANFKLTTKGIRRNLFVLSAMSF